MQQDRSIALARLREELERPPFHAVLRPRPIDADPDSGTVTVALDYRDELARAPHDKSFHGGVIATLIDLAGHAAVAVKIGKMAPTIDLRIDYFDHPLARTWSHVHGCSRLVAWWLVSMSTSPTPAGG